MDLGGHTLCQGQLHGDEHRLFIVLKNQGEDVCHLAITTWLAQHVILQLPEGRRQFCEGCAIPKRPGLALNDSQIVSPVVDRPRWQVVAAVDDPLMLAQDVTEPDPDLHRWALAPSTAQGDGRSQSLWS
jgi:hypothetical protein